ncbi:MAG: hypothetical protein IJY28_02510 [Clostridia bacterium]|nr:hypothetical protein [Clostridia bacterium]
MTTQEKSKAPWLQTIGHWAVSAWNMLVRVVKKMLRGIRRWWKLGDGYQQKGRGWAVSGFIFSLLNLLLLGCVPPLSYLAVVCGVIAICKHNRALISVLSIVLGVAGIWLSGELYQLVHMYAANPEQIAVFLNELLG